MELTVCSEWTRIRVIVGFLEGKINFGQTIQQLM
jgi:hypothetical protein